MGYSYYILIQGIKGSGEYEDLFYTSNSGSYGFIQHHYFVNKGNVSFTYSGTKEMGEEQRLFTYQDLRIRYEEEKMVVKETTTKFRDQISHLAERIEGESWRVLVEILSSHEYQGMSHKWDTLQCIKSCLGDVNGDAIVIACENSGSCVAPFEELSEYWKMCKGFVEDGYRDVRLIFGMTQ